MTTEDNCVKPLHKHIMIRAMVKKTPDNEETVITWLRGLVEFLGMKIIQGPFATYIAVPGNKGMTATVMIETSHIAFHVWDEQQPGLLQFDVYTCGQLDVDGVLTEVHRFFDFVSFEYAVYDRERSLHLIDYRTNFDS